MSIRQGLLRTASLFGLLMVMVSFVGLQAFRAPGLIKILNDANELTLRTIASGIEKMAVTDDSPAEKKTAQVISQGRAIKADAVFFEDIVGLDNALIEIMEVVDFLKNPKKYADMGAKMPKGILLEGPPGCGKTLIAKAMANEANCQFFSIAGSDFVEKYVGVGASRVRDLFAQARAQAPSIIFIDEIDAIGAVKRGEGGNEEYRQTINQLLKELDGFESRSDVMIIAATNYAHAIDEALIRSGRFNTIIHIDMPDKEGRMKLFDYYLSKIPKTALAQDITIASIEQFAIMTDGLSPADIENIVGAAPRLAIRNKSLATSKATIVQSIEHFMRQRKVNHPKNDKKFFNQ